MPALTARQYAKILYDLTAGQKADAQTRGVEQFLLFLQKKQAIKLLDRIVTEFAAYAKAKEGIEPVTVTTARPMSADALREIAGHFVKKPEVSAALDPDIIGGAIVASGSKIFDASIRRQLLSAKHTLASLS